MTRSATADDGNARPIWIVLPVKPLAEGKSRLALAEGERRRLNAAFFAHVLSVARTVVAADRVVVISHDETVLAGARRVGARALREREGGDLNDALAAAAWFVRARGAAAVLSIFTDLPVVARDDLQAMIDAFGRSDLVIAPDRSGSGSNALLMRPGAIPYRHGAGSFWRHLDAAREANIDFAVIRRPGLMSDVDGPEDLAALAPRFALTAR